MSIRKMLLVPEQEMLQRAQLHQLDPGLKKTVEMGKKLDNVFLAALPDDVKAKLVAEVLDKLQNLKGREYISHAALQPPTLSNGTSDKAKLVAEVLETLEHFNGRELSANVSLQSSTADTPKPAYDFKAIVKSLPPRMRTKATELFEVIGDDIPETLRKDPDSLAHLTKYALNKKSKKHQPDGWQQYEQLLQDKNVVSTMAPALLRTPLRSAKNTPIKTPIKRNLRNKSFTWIPY